MFSHKEMSLITLVAMLTSAERISDVCFLEVYMKQLTKINIEIAYVHFCGRCLRDFSVNGYNFPTFIDYTVSNGSNP